MKYAPTLIILVAVLFEVVADVLFKKWSLDNRQLYLGVGLALYFIGTCIWAYSLKYEGLSKAVTIFTVLNFVLVLLAGFLLFNESLSLVNKLGIVLGVVSVILVQL